MASSVRPTSQLFIQNDKLDLLFSGDIIPDAVIRAFPADLHIRPLASTDYKRGHLRILNQLTQSPDCGEEAWINQFNTLRSTSNSYYQLAIIDKQTDRIVGLGTVFKELKFQRKGRPVGHIEDIVIDEGQRGKNLGRLIIDALTLISENHFGAYKTILNCNKDNTGFYKKCGYEEREVEMVKYVPEKVLEESHFTRL